MLKHVSFPKCCCGGGDGDDGAVVVDNGCVSMMFHAVRQDGGIWYQVDVCYKQNKNYYYLKCEKTIIHKLSSKQKACL